MKKQKAIKLLEKQAQGWIDDNTGFAPGAKTDPSVLPLVKALRMGAAALAWQSTEEDKEEIRKISEFVGVDASKIIRLAIRAGLPEVSRLLGKA